MANTPDTEQPNSTTTPDSMLSAPATPAPAATPDQAAPPAAPTEATVPTAPAAMTTEVPAAPAVPAPAVAEVVAENAAGTAAPGTPAPAQHTQATEVLPPAGDEAGGVPPLPPAGGQGGASFGIPAEPKKPADKSKGNVLLVGLAIGALLGGIVGGGVAAIVSANAHPATTAVNQSTVTLNNPETVTDVTQVALVATPSVVTVMVQGDGSSGSGSGVIYGNDGYIITNAHVALLDGATSSPTIQVKLHDGSTRKAELVGTAPYTDIAVLKVDPKGLTPIKVADSNEVNVGDLAVAIGAPMSLSNTVTSGIVSALNRGITVGSPLVPSDPNNQPEGESNSPWDFRFDAQGQDQKPTGAVTLPVIQTDASINPGNSGGALLNGAGELIGINVAIASPGATEAGAGSAGLGFAIPANAAARVADEIIAGEKPSYGLLGASVVDASQDTDADAQLAGGLIAEVVRGGAAAKAGLKVGDVVTAVDGVPAADGVTVSALVRTHGANEKVTVDYSRAGVPGQVEVTLGSLDW